MDLSLYNPSGVGVKDTGIFGLPHTQEEAEVVLIPVGWDVTTSYKPGTHKGPQAVRDASPQLDLFHPDFPDLWKRGVFMHEELAWISASNTTFREYAEHVISQLESGETLEEIHLALRDKVNAESARLTAWLKEESLKQLRAGKMVGVVGGDHSVPLGLMQALAEHEGEYGILHFDAHHDFRDAYMGFAESHASIMHNAAKIPQVTRFVQVGIRDYCEEEVAFTRADPERFVTFYDQQLQEAAFQGVNWHRQCEEIVSRLPEKIYFSFDIDGLAPHLCPGTGTPVPGGLLFEQAVYLIKLAARARKVIGFDLVEVGGAADSIDANIGARLLWNLCGYALCGNEGK